MRYHVCYLCHCYPLLVEQDYNLRELEHLTEVDYVRYMTPLSCVDCKALFCNDCIFQHLQVSIGCCPSCGGKGKQDQFMRPPKPISMVHTKLEFKCPFEVCKEKSFMAVHLACHLK